MCQWDAENRLIRVAPTAGTEQEDDKKVEFAYDYLGRRVQKQVWTHNGSTWDLTLHRKFVWSGWLMLLELDGLNSDAVVRKYTWGLDLAGQNGSLNSLQGAGGTLDKTAPRQGQVGGLLAVYDVAEEDDYVYFYDANGNVGQLVNLGAGTVQAGIVAHYEYDPYGNLTASTGTYADDNPFRFSTKYWDDETGLGYWAYRYYSPGLGRWINRDPAGESKGLNLYGYTDNRPTLAIDALGLCCVQQGKSHDFNPNCFRPKQRNQATEEDISHIPSAQMHLYLYSFYHRPWVTDFDWVRIGGQFLDDVSKQSQVIAFADASRSKLRLDAFHMVSQLCCDDSARFKDCDSTNVWADKTWTNVLLTLGGFTVYWTAECSIGPRRCCVPAPSCPDGYGSRAQYKCEIRWKVYDHYDFWDFGGWSAWGILNKAIVYPVFGSHGTEFWLEGEWSETVVGTVYNCKRCD